ncbi:MAG: ABC transporter ATP-binding protein [Opitutales bacterium]
MIELTNICIRAEAFRLDNISLAVPSAQYGILMGGTGSGKTTLLETIAGLRRPKSGIVRLDGQEVTRWRPADRGIGYVPQDGALFPSMTVRRQLGFPLEIRRQPKEEIATRVAELAEALGIAHLLDRGPAHLSGGERQRVALGRALSFNPQVLLLDEPLSALDEATRSHLGDVLKNLPRTLNLTVLHVTHDRKEAERLGDCSFVLSDSAVVTG